MSFMLYEFNNWRQKINQSYKVKLMRLVNSMLHCFFLFFFQCNSKTNTIGKSKVSNKTAVLKVFYKNYLVYKQTPGLAKQFSVHLQIKWCWVQLPQESLSDIADVLIKDFPDIQATTEYRLTLKRVCDVIRTHRRSLVFLNSLMTIPA